MGSTTKPLDSAKCLPDNMIPLVRFQDHGVEQLYVTQDSFHNRHQSASNGNYCPHRFEKPFRCIVRKHQRGDILWAHLGLVCLISDHLRRLFEAEGITGFNVQSADVRLMFPHEQHEAVYWVMCVTGWAGMAHPRSGIMPLPDPDGSGRLVYSPASDPNAIVDWTQWDGSDFFIVWPLPMLWWVSPRVSNLLYRHNIRHFKLASPSELGLDRASNGIGFSPGRLRQYFPEDRALVLGEPLGIY